MIPKKLVSFLLPSRGRPQRLVGSLQSIAATCLDPTCYEVLVRADVDDDATRDAVREMNDPHNICFVGERGRGYLDLHLMVNQLAANAVGLYLFLWNDDAFMLTHGWDEVLRSKLGEGPKVYKPFSEQQRNRNIFPIMQREIYDATQRFSESALNDFYSSTVAQKAGIEAPIDISIRHDHPAAGGTIHDQTFLEAVEACGVCKYDSRDARILACIDEDVAKVQQMLATRRQ